MLLPAWAGPAPREADARALEVQAPAQPATESPDAAAAGLVPYLLPEADAPAGYSFTFTRAYDNAAQTLDALTAAPPDPRQPAEILEALESAGRVVRLVQGIEMETPDSAAGLRAGLVLFRDADAAARALQDVSAVAIVLPSDQVTPIDAPALGEGSLAYRIDYRDEAGELVDRTHVVLWRQGRVLFSTSAYGSAEQADAALPTIVDLARTYQGRVAALPVPPAAFAPPPTFMPNAQARVERYLQLRERLLPDEAIDPHLEVHDVTSISNAILVMDARDAAPPLTDPNVVVERVVDRQHRIVGVMTSMRPVEGAANPPGSRFPDVSYGYHLYADAAGAADALAAPTEEIALRMYEEADFGKPSGLQLGEVTVPGAIGEQARAFGALFTTSDTNLPVALVSIRWRRGPVELYVDVAAPPTLDVTALTGLLVQQLDAAYAANPLPGV